MKKAIIVLSSMALLAACNNEKKTDDKTGGEKTAEKSNITYPFTPGYSTDFSLGDPNHTKMVLEFAKSWMDNKMSDMRSMLTDSVWADFADGGKFLGTADSLMRMGQQVRDMYSKIEAKYDTWMPLHVNDKNEDWVLVWEKDYNTDKNGKVDSVGSHSYWQIKNGKIAGWAEFQQKLTPPAMPDK
jgi:hypothetical protein